MTRTLKTILSIVAVCGLLNVHAQTITQKSLDSLNSDFPNRFTGLNLSLPELPKNTSTITGKIDTNSFLFTPNTIKLKPMSIYIMGLNVWFRQSERNIIPSTIDTVYIHVKPKQVRFINDTTLIITK